MKGSFFLSVSALWRREMVRFVRQRSRIVGAFASPLIFWLLLGFGVGKSINSSPIRFAPWDIRNTFFRAPF